MHIKAIAKILTQVDKDSTFAAVARMADRRHQSMQLYLGQVIWACTQLRDELDMPNERWRKLLATAAEYLASAQITAGELQATHRELGRELGRLACDLDFDPDTGEHYVDHSTYTDTQSCTGTGTQTMDGRTL